MYSVAGHCPACHTATATAALSVPAQLKQVLVIRWRRELRKQYQADKAAGAFESMRPVDTQQHRADQRASMQALAQSVRDVQARLPAYAQYGTAKNLAEVVPRPIEDVVEEADLELARMLQNADAGGCLQSTTSSCCHERPHSGLHCPIHSHAATCAAGREPTDDAGARTPTRDGISTRAFTAPGGHPFGLAAASAPSTHHPSQQHALQGIFDTVQAQLTDVSVLMASGNTAAAWDRLRHALTSGVAHLDGE
jgi:hypothetical protein